MRAPAVMLSILGAAGCSTAEPHAKCGQIVVVYLFAAPFVLVGLMIALSFAITVVRRRIPAKGPGDAVTLLVADHLTRAVLRSASSWAVAWSVATVGVAASAFSALVPAMLGLGLFPVSSIIGARRVLRELDAEHARAELRGTVLIVRSKTGQARVAATPRLIDQARRHVVPTSTAL